MIDGGQLDSDELTDLLVNDVELELIVGRDDFLPQLRKLVQYPPVQPGQLVVMHRVFRRVEVIEVRELVAQRIAENAVGLGHFADPLLANDDIVAEVLRGNPEAHDVRAVLLDVRVRGLRLLVAGLALLALGNLLAVGVHHEAVRKHGLVRRRAIARQREEQR